MYAIMAIFGICFAFAISMFKRKAFGLKKRDIARLVMFAIVGALVGAKLFQLIGYVIRDGGNPGFWTFEHWKGLMTGVGVFYGGLLGAVGAAVLCAKISRIDVESMFNIAAYAGFAFQSFGRIGCYCAGCCYGILLSHGARFPVQLLEAAFCFVSLLAFLTIKPERRTQLPLFPFFVIQYSIGRFAFEFLRGDANRGHFWLLSTSQWIALLLIALAIFWLMKVRKIQCERKYVS
jgi:phosphatidylglycerol:prolipoprotein diacylglycerol transferase